MTAKREKDITKHPFYIKDPVARQRALDQAVERAKEILFPSEPPKEIKFKRETRLVFNSVKDFDKFYKKWKKEQKVKK
ncbi:hypothetical protein SAMN05444673_2824 [Bacillus sp. OV166]|uniref:hypothetical protein n=1 Tax=Bacillus sp. OV166 TaxID=1882763 RepID=UPI000A2AADE4|nr:hypothetical protein [Bacillus sp. OV166]SMQ77496.1 hypothetical protein SAMN05444673_2824 [Bacillus sp. OV166]